MPAQARSSRQQRSFFVQTRDRFAGSRICFWGWENFVCWSDSNRTVALKNGLLRHRSAQSAARFDGKSHFFVQPRNCSAGLRVCFWGGRFLLTGRTWTGSVGWQTSEPMCSFLVCLTKPLATIYNFKCISQNAYRAIRRRMEECDDGSEEQVHKRRDDGGGAAGCAAARAGRPDGQDHGGRARHVHAARLYCVWFNGRRSAGCLCRRDPRI